MAEWRDDVKEALLLAGIEDRPLTFLFTDTQIIDEQQVEDLNSILNTGDLPNIYEPDEMDRIMQTCRVECQRKRIPPTKINIFSQYIVRVRRNIHIVVAMSPLGDDFRNRLRMFPSLVNCCTIDWFHPWPERCAQISRFAAADDGKDLGLPKEILPHCVEICKVIHQTVEVKSEEYLRTLMRRNYVTPTSYLELLNTYSKTLLMKRSEIQQKCDRLANGVDKLVETGAAVTKMQAELTALQPVLKQKTTEVNEMMVVISKDRESAAVTKAQVEKEEQGAAVKADKCKEIADDAQRDLDEALPAPAAAVKCLDKLDKNHINEVKVMISGKPPNGVKLTVEATCIMFGIKPKKIKNPDDQMGPKINDYFGVAKAELFQRSKEAHGHAQKI